LFKLYLFLKWNSKNGEKVFSEYNFEVKDKEILKYELPSKWVDKQFIHAEDIKLK